MRTISLRQLRPTQCVHGVREVRQKAQSYRALSQHDLGMAIAEKPVPVVLGPAEECFAIDHHHVAAAAWEVDIESLPCVLVEDLSSLSLPEFWLELENRRWTYPYDPSGQRVAFSAMPGHVWELADDEYRSLAALLRDAGGYEHTRVPLAEFRWTEWLRPQLPRPRDDAEFASSLKKALKLAASAAAAGLPGYIGKKSG